MQKKCLPIITFSFYTDHGNALLRDLKLFKLSNIFNERPLKLFYKFSRKELPKSVCSQFKVGHEVHTPDARNNSLIYIPRICTSQYGNHYLHGDCASLWNKLFKDFFKTMIWRSKIDVHDLQLTNEVISYKTIPTSSGKLIINYFWHTFKQFPLNFFSWTFSYEMQSIYNINICIYNIDLYIDMFVYMYLYLYIDVYIDNIYIYIYIYIYIFS